MRFAFTHCHGSGNDFVLIDARDLALTPAQWAIVARALSDRAGPVGSDGLLLLGLGRAEAAFAMTMLNPDGSEAETCLNGLRCIARAGFEALGIDHATVRLATSTATVHRVADLAPGVYTIEERAGPVSLDLAAWPLHGAGEQLIDAPLPPLGAARRFTAVAMPNPHLIAFVERIDDEELAALGRTCEAGPDWLPRRANVSFVAHGEGSLFVRTFERGAGLTASCGSAMAAAVYAACLTERADWGTTLTVNNHGGRVSARAAPDAVTIAGNATWEWDGSVDIDLATGAVSDVTVVRRYPEEIAAWAAVG